jgi:adenylyltransferase/sulfurtransferase
MFAFSEAQIRRYSRQIILPHVGGRGQRKLLSSKVLVVGAGGLGSPAAVYLAAAGVGTLGLVDSDTVDLSNLQRQILHTTADVGRPKTESAAETIRALNPDVDVVLHAGRLTSENALEVLRAYDVVIEGSDNFPTKYLVNDACVLLRKPLVLGAVYRFEGQASVFLPEEGPCYRCIFPEPPPPGAVPSCQEAGVLGVLPGVIGCIQATETIKLLLGVGQTLSGRFLVFDALRMEFIAVQMERDPECPVCGHQPTVMELMDYEFSCAVRQAGQGGDGG